MYGSSGGGMPSPGFACRRLSWFVTHPSGAMPMSGVAQECPSARTLVVVRLRNARPTSSITPVSMPPVITHARVEDAAESMPSRNIFSSRGSRSIACAEPLTVRSTDGTWMRQ